MPVTRQSKTFYLMLSSYCMYIILVSLFFSKKCQFAHTRALTSFEFLLTRRPYNPSVSLTGFSYRAYCCIIIKQKSKTHDYVCRISSIFIRYFPGILLLYYRKLPFAPVIDRILTSITTPKD